MSSTSSSTQIDDLDGPITLHVENGRGTVEVSATDTTGASIELNGPDIDDVRIDLVGDDLFVIVPQRRGGFLAGERRVDIVATVPTRSSLTAKLGSADLTAQGSYDHVAVRSGSGDISLDVLAGPALVETGTGGVRIELAEQALRVKSGSGDVTVGRTAHDVSISTGSGDVQIDTCTGSTQVKTGSGDLSVAHAEASVSLTTGSGDLVVDEMRGGRLQLKGASGDLRLGVPAGLPVWTDVSTVSGQITSTLEGAGQPEPGADHLEIHATTVSGDIILQQL